MPYKLLQKSLDLLLKRQTNILSAAFIIMITVVFSQVLGLIRQWVLVRIFGPSEALGVYLAATKIPDLLFQLIVAGTLSAAFIPVFSQYLAKGETSKANNLASSVIVLCLLFFTVIALLVFIFAPFFSHLIAPGFPASHVELMSQFVRIILISELLFIVGSFLSVILQSHNHFFIPGIAAAFYNLGMIIGILFFSRYVGIYSAAYGSLLGAFIFLVIQWPMGRRVGFHFKPSFDFKLEGMVDILRLTWPRTLAIGVFQLGTMAILALISFLPSPGRNYVLFDYAQTLAFAPVVLFGQTIAQAAFPILSREKDRLEEFRATFSTSFSQIMYLILPVSALLLVLRIPVVRLVFGTAKFDWNATVLTGSTLAFFSISIFAQGLIYLVSRGFYALHDTKTPLIIGTITMAVMIALGGLFVFYYEWGIEGIALASSIGGILNLIVLMIFLDKKIGGFIKREMFYSLAKIFVATVFTGIALYIPIKLLDKLVFDTTRTINLIFLGGISSFSGLTLYLFLTWLFNVKEATNFILLFKRVGNWREVLDKTHEIIDGKVKP